MPVSPSLALSRLDLREAIAWTSAAAIVLAAHLAIAYAAQHFRPSDPAGGDSPPALTIELAPMVSVPAVAEQAEPADEVAPEMAEPVDEPETIAAAEPEAVERAEETPIDEAVDPPADNPPDIVEPDQMVEAEPVEAQPVEAPQKPLDEVVPDVAIAVDPEVVVPLPEAAPVKAKPTAKKKVEKSAPKAVQKKAETPAPKKEKAKKTSKPAASASAAKSAPTGAAGKSKPRVSSANWKAKVVSWLRRHQRYPAGAKSRREQGNVQVAFSIDGGGRVKSARISRSSGNAELDRAALDMVRRSSPVPAPPDGETTRSLVVPVAFNLK